MAAHALTQPEALMTPEEYLRGDFEPDVDYVDGRIEDRNVGEYDHSTWQEAIQAWFRAHYPEWKLRARPELRARITPTRYRVPDVAVMDMNLPVEQILLTPPVAVFEILSPEDRLQRIMVKLSDYEAMGVRNILVLDTAKKVFLRFRDGQLQPTSENEVLEGSRGHVNWAELEKLIY